ncbi:hypothetical protein NM688_g7983 [Phlebia brevispora]|uniref:Uncharacterized protein n=1 Tax=Phlebia brevispora TaxID=194682 RepID=A0ACC1RYY1_9APHY|nr:hypothetical protein NM688_g7983 [Phlebia brevispora]
MIPAPTKDKAPALSPAQTLVDGRLPGRTSNARRYLLLVIFCLAQFLDAFNNSALFSAIPSLVRDLGFTEGESTWLISAFQLTFASFLLISGRISDVYNPKYAFIFGVSVLGCICIGAGFVPDKITLIVLRALSGIAASMTIPSALTLLVNLFPEPKEQARAIGVFGGCGAVGNVLGLIIGAIFVQFANWSWVFWFVAIIAIPIGLVCFFLVPNPHRAVDVKPAKGRWKSLDLAGISILTSALILFIFAVTSGSTAGWASAMVLAPLIIAVFMVAGFFFYEKHIPPSTAAVPPRTWFLPNFSVLFGLALMPYLWWTTLFTILTALWQGIYQWSAISVALRMIPIGALAFATSFSGPLSERFSPKYVLLAGQALLVVATVLLALADSPDKYWPYVFPAFMIGSTGAMLSYVHTNIAIFRTTPSSMAGTVGAIFNGALQLGSAVGISAVSSIETSIEEQDGNPAGYRGRAAAFWFMLAIVCIEIISIIIFYDVDAEMNHGDEDSEKDVEKDIENDRRSMTADPEAEIIEEPKAPEDADELNRIDEKRSSIEKRIREVVREESVV